MLLTVLMQAFKTISSHVTAGNDLSFPFQPGQLRMEVVRSSGWQTHGSDANWQSLIVMPAITSSWRAVLVPPEVAPAARSTHACRKVVASL